MLKRHIVPYIKDLLTQFSVVLLNGARQCGKSTLATQLIQEKILIDSVNLDNKTLLEAANTDPDGFLQQFEQSVVIDEVQRLPDLLRAIKYDVDQNKRTGRFFLTGSASVLSYPGVAESLAGRMAIVVLEGLSLTELLQRKPTTFIEDLFSNKSIASHLRKWREKSKQVTINKKQMAEYIFYGGYPEIALKQNTSFSKHWFSSYLQAYVERDVRDFNKNMDSLLFDKLFKILATQTGNLLNIHKTASLVGIDQRTAAKYMKLYELTFQLQHLQPWFNTTRSRIIKTPKIYCKDSGMATYLNGLGEPKEILNTPCSGALFETWVYAELRKLLENKSQISCYFYATHSGKEVDFILTKGQKIVAIECKFSVSLSAEDFSGLRAWQQEFPHSLGIVLYCGNQVIAFDKQLIALPVICLT